MNAENKYKVFTHKCQGTRKLFEYKSPEDFQEYILSQTKAKQEAYESIFIYNDETKNEVDKTGSVAGTHDVVTDRIVFDFDHKQNLEIAFSSARELVNRLIKQGIDDSAIRVYFSGNKGYHVELILEDEYITQPQFKTLVYNLAMGLEGFDTSINDPNRIFRSPLSYNVGGKKYKYPIPLENFLDEDMTNEDFITSDYATNPYEKNTYNEIKTLLSSYKKIKLPESFKPMMITDESVKKVNKEVNLTPLVGTIDRPDMSNKPKHLSEAKYAIMQGFFEEGERNHACLIMAATFRAQGYPKEVSYNMLKSMIRLRNRRLGLDEEISDTTKVDLWKEVSYVYDPKWEGGTYSEKDGLLATIIQRYSLQKTADQEFGLVEIKDIADHFKDFAVNIDKNTIKLGIDEIDEKVRITTSMFVCLLAPPSAGKCFGKGTKVRMFDGSVKNIEDIQVGELVMGDDSTPRTVLSLGRGNEELFKISQNYGEDYIVNKSHILSLKNVTDLSKMKERELNTIEYGEKIDISLEKYLKKSKKFRKYVKGYKAKIDYPSRSITLDPYLLGAWLGDGTSDKPQISTPDMEIVEYFDKVLEKHKLFRKSICGNLTHTYSNNKLNRGTKGSNYLIKSLQQLNVWENKHIPQQYLINDRNVRLQLLAGIIDTDGYLCPKNKIQISSKSEIFAKQIVELCRSLGFKSVLTKKNAKYKSWNKAKTKLYEGSTVMNIIYISGDDINLIPCKVPRKKPKDIILSTHVLSTRIKVESIGNGDYYGFSLDGNHRFLLEDFTVVHNTSVAFGVLNAISKNNEKAIFFSMDMAIPQIYQRLIQRETGHDEKVIMQNYQNDNKEEIQKYQDILNTEFKNVKFCFRTGVTTDNIRNSIIAEIDKMGVKPRLVVIDYLECIAGPFSDPTANKALIATQLKDIANELGVCIFLLVQPAKISGDPSHELTSYTQIKGSSVLGEAATIVMAMYRPGFSPKRPEDDKFLTINVVKNRMGKLSSTDLHWTGLTGRLRKLEPEEKTELEEIRQRKANEESGGGNDYMQGTKFVPKSRGDLY